MSAHRKNKSLSIKKIMCPVDFSEVSLNALHRADELAGYFNAELLVINVVQPVSTVGEEANYSLYEFNTPTYEDKLLKDTRKHLKSILAQEISRKSRVHTLVQPGDPSSVIVSTAAKKQVDLIVMSPHGAGWFKHLLFGSVAEKVIRTAPCPVLIIRGPDDAGEKMKN